MMATLEEQEPGVYVRSNRPDQELDFLWDRERKKNSSEEGQRFPLGFFLAGAITGSLITLSVLFLINGQAALWPAPVPEQPPVVEEQGIPEDVLHQQKAAVTSPTETRETPPVKAPEPVAEPTESVAPEKPKSKGFQLPFFGGKNAEEAPKTDETPELKSQTYKVKSGDTLGSIAIQFYQSSSPAMVAKIQQANNMSDADTLSLDQELVIPPKSAE